MSRTRHGIHGLGIYKAMYSINDTGMEYLTSGNANSELNALDTLFLGDRKAGGK